ncbi:SDR family NAD(P)-dependent oxidoreductase [Kutzneria sp. NPDC051319]|uniref:SDR family NAD(P)-dependent oxidoreductase n=1 Tax=Kutzneria sp. NPDC051319 TaxID=3155047 RepID=UPI00342346D1
MKTALITGAGRGEGLGFAVATQLSELGYHVILTARDLARVEPLAAALGNATALRLDLAQPGAMASVADNVTRTFGHLDVLVNNASDVVDFAVLSALDADISAVRSALDVDVLGPWHLVQTLLPMLKKASAARVVNVSSVSALQIAIGLDLGASLRAPAHSFAKHTLNVLTEVLARALADTPILVNSVDPGATATHPERGDDADDRSPADSARGVVWAATLPPDGPTGGFFRDGLPLTTRGASPLA